MNDFKRTYNIIRTIGDNKVDKSIAGTAIAVALCLFVVISKKTIANNRFYHTFVPKVYSLLFGLVTDGYLMVAFSPLVLVYWALASIFIASIYILFLAIMAALCIIVIISAAWTIFIECPASLMNKERVWFFENHNNIKEK